MVQTIATWYQGFVNRSQGTRRTQIITTLRRIPVFGDLPSGVLRDLASVVHTRTFRRDEYIYYENDPGLGLYIVQEGKVRLTTENEDGSMTELRTVEPFGLFGFISALGDFVRTETAQAATETSVLGFFQPDLNSMLKRNPRSGAAVMAALAQLQITWQLNALRLLALRNGKGVAARLFHEAARETEVSAALPILD